jgi:hypothetical protein
MNDTVSCIASLTGSCTATDLRLQDVQQIAAVEVAQRDLFADMATRAITKAVEEPHKDGVVARGHADLVGSVGGDIATRKTDLLSTVARPGATPVLRPDAAQGAIGDPIIEVSQRIKTLYMELTEFHIAWKVGQKVQQDTAHILRGQ